MLLLKQEIIRKKQVYENVIKLYFEASNSKKYKIEVI